ncbi:unnamed protein product [Brassica rapa subsp. trilocularis]
MNTQHRNNVSGDCQSINLRHHNTRSSKPSDHGRESSSALPIPTDLIIDIFSRLPLKSIAICRCVSKTWASTLRRQDFTDFYLRKSSTRPQILLAPVKNRELFFFSSPQPQYLQENLPSVVANCHMKLSFGGFGEIRCGRPVHGLACLRQLRVSEGERETVLFICNPSTRQVLHLPKVKTSRPVVKSMFGYDPIDKQFKVLCMTRFNDGRDYHEHQVLTLGAPDRSWRMLECCIPHYGDPPKEICINGVLYYKSINKSTETYLIVCFDVRSEMFSFIEVKVTLQRALLRGALRNCNGKLGLFISEDNGYFRSSVSERSTSVQLWVLEDVEKQEWSDHIYLLPALWKNLVGRDCLFFAGVTLTNEIVLAPSFSSYPFYLYYLNTKRNTVVARLVEIQGIDVSDYYMDHVVLDHVEDVKLYDV